MAMVHHKKKFTRQWCIVTTCKEKKQKENKSFGEWMQMVHQTLATTI
jgi:hypothetical protein